MAKSAKQIEAEVLAFLDTIGESVDLFTEVKDLKGLEALVGKVVGEFILQVQENLNKGGIVDTGALSTDITQGEWDGSSITVGYPAESKAAKYYDYVNKGVKGYLEESKAPNSPYRYQSEYPEYGGVLHKALMKWYRRNAGAGRIETQKKNLSAVQRKRKKLSKMVDADTKLRSLAYATAINIKRKGLKTTGYFDKAVEKYFGNDFNRLVAKVVGREIAVNIRKSNQ